MIITPLSLSRAPSVSVLSFLPRRLRPRPACRTVGPAGPSGHQLTDQAALLKGTIRGVFVSPGVAPLCRDVAEGERHQSAAEWCEASDGTLRCVDGLFGMRGASMWTSDLMFAP